MVKTMGARAMAENHSLSLASYEGSDPDLGKYEKKRNIRAINMCHVLKG